MKLKKYLIFFKTVSIFSTVIIFSACKDPITKTNENIQEVTKDNRSRSGVLKAQALKFYQGSTSSADAESHQNTVQIMPTSSPIQSDFTFHLDSAQDLTVTSHASSIHSECSNNGSDAQVTLVIFKHGQSISPDLSKGKSMRLQEGDYILRFSAHQEGCSLSGSYQFLVKADAAPDFESERPRSKTHDDRSVPVKKSEPQEDPARPPKDPTLHVDYFSISNVLRSFGLLPTSLFGPGHHYFESASNKPEFSLRISDNGSQFIFRLTANKAQTVWEGPISKVIELANTVERSLGINRFKITAKTPSGELDYVFDTISSPGESYPTNFQLKDSSGNTYDLSTKDPKYIPANRK